MVVAVVVVVVNLVLLFRWICAKDPTGRSDAAVAPNKKASGSSSFMMMMMMIMIRLVLVLVLFAPHKKRQAPGC